MKHSALKLTKAGAGRRTLLTAELQRNICAFIRAGAYDYAAAEASGISRRAFFEWLERGERESRRSRAPVYVQFARTIRQAGPVGIQSGEVALTDEQRRARALEIARLLKEVGALPSDVPSDES